MRVELFDLKGKKLSGDFESPIEKAQAEIYIRGKFDGIKPWSPEAPNLYDMRVTLMQEDEILHLEQKCIGFRTIELRENDGFYVNGEKVVFKGINRPFKNWHVLTREYV